MITAKKYVFGYLFVRLAKTLAILTLLAGLVAVGLEYARASLAVSGLRYRTSVALQTKLDGVSAEWRRTASLVETLPSAAQEVASLGSISAFPNPIESARDFEAAAETLRQIADHRQSAKNLMVKHFETLVGTIEGQLRAHAAQLEEERRKATAASATAAPSPTPEPVELDLPTQTIAPVETLFASDLGRSAIEQRKESLDRGREFLKVLVASAENAANNQALSQSVDELGALRNCLPTPVEAAPASEAHAKAVTPQPVIESPPMRQLNAQKVAEKIAQLRQTVRTAVLSTWRIDEILSDADGILESERQRAQAADYLVRARWLAAVGYCGAAIAAALLTSFLVLVFADLLQTFFDTASNTAALVGRQSADPR